MANGFSLLNRVLPAAAWLTLAVNVLAWSYHRRWYRALPGMIGPCVILPVLNFWFATPWRTDAIYAALALMLLVSARDILHPAGRHCALPGEPARERGQPADGNRGQPGHA